jgi:hypothetical protein
MRCEDFPCCGHYEQSTGDIFCGEYLENERRANLSPMEREIEDSAERIRARYETEAKAAKAKAEYDAAPDEHDETQCDDGNLCKDCLADASDWEERRTEAERDFD